MVGLGQAKVPFRYLETADLSLKSIMRRLHLTQFSSTRSRISVEGQDGSAIKRSTRVIFPGPIAVVTVDKSIREEDRSDDEEKDENEEDDICQLLDQRTASQRRDKSCAPSH